MGTLWDQLLGYARSRQQQKPPTIRKDLWDAVEQLQELRALGVATEAFEMLESA